MSYVSFYVTFPDKDTAMKVIHQVVEERLAACGNSFAIDSCYNWKEEIHQEQEIGAIIKTSSFAANKLSERLLELHPYEVPCISNWETNANESYESWVNQSTISSHDA